ncbi:MAG TPA: hypothetical protein VMG58_16410, partial [Candidatus Sulfotelmatobacter sp.]|nr:hypothetical protein [Candidatus Sulfotelmatobacter sp.]
MRNKGRWLAVLALVAIASLFGGCATGGRPAITGLRAAFVTYVIPKDPRLTNLRGRAAARLSLPAYEVSDTQETVTGLSNTFWPDGALVVDRFTAARSKGRRSGVEYRIQQETIEQA